MLTKIIGIINLTPDSFSDGGSYNGIDSVIGKILKMIDCGVSIIDIGAQSTRPDAKIIGWQNEWQILSSYLPKIVEFCHHHKILVSLDSFYPQIIERAIGFGINIVNDVLGIEGEVLKIIANNNLKIVTMHNLGIPTNREIIIDPSLNLFNEIKSYFFRRIKILVSSGISECNIILDPGIGFGKNSSQSMEIIRHIDEIRIGDIEIMVGHSRKSFIKLVDNDTNNSREKDLETALISFYLSQKKVDYLRVHNVEYNARAINLFRNLYL